jgi:hypothetical protein
MAQSGQKQPINPNGHIFFQTLSSSLVRAARSAEEHWVRKMQAYATSPLFLDNLHFEQFVPYFNLGFVHDILDELFEMEIV